MIPIDLDAAIAQHVGSGRGVAAAQDRAQAGQQFAWLEWFGQVVIRAHFEPDDAVHRVATGGQRQDGAVGACADLPTDVQAVGVRQHESRITTSAGSRPCNASPRVPVSA